jgi:hypothetical protein
MSEAEQDSSISMAIDFTLVIAFLTSILSTF